MGHAMALHPDAHWYLEQGRAFLASLSAGQVTVKAEDREVEEQTFNLPGVLCRAGGQQTLSASVTAGPSAPSSGWPPWRSLVMYAWDAVHADCVRLQ